MSDQDNLKFEKIFGQKRKDIAETLIISPFFSAKLFSGKLTNASRFKGMLYHGLSATVHGKKITYINTGIGQSMIADCVLAQSNKQIKKIIFLGAAGAISDFKINDCILVERVFFDTEYFNNFGLSFNAAASRKNFGADAQLSTQCLKHAVRKKFKLHPARMISLQSLWQQDEKLLQRLRKQKIQTVDLESALFYATASAKKISAIALCYVSDQPNVKPYWRELTSAQRSMRKICVSHLIDLALELAQS